MIVLSRRRTALSGSLLILLAAGPLAGPALAAAENPVIDNGAIVNLPGDRPNPWTADVNLFVGFEGEGTLNVTDGAVVNASFAILGNLAGSAGKLTVTGPQTRFNSLRGQAYGTHGSADVLFADGARIVSGGTVLGQEVDGQASLLLEGEDTQWDMSGSLAVGRWGKADLTVRDGRITTGTFIQLARRDGAEGSITLDGGSLSSQRYTYVGLGGRGVITLINGARVDTALGLLGYESTGSGELHLSGADTLWSGKTYLYLGYNGEGLATVADGATVRITTDDDSPSLVILGGLEGSSGTLYIGGEDAVTGAGVLDVQEVRYGAGEGTLVFNHSDADYRFLPVLNGHGRVEHRAGDTWLTSTSKGFSGDASLTGGTLTLAADDALGSATLELDGGTLATWGDITLGHSTVQLTDTTLRSEKGTATFTGTLDLGDSLLTVDGPGNTVLSGDISAGTGALDMIGSGRLTLTGDASAFSGQHRVNDGVLSVDGTLGGQLTVFSGGRLQGNGQVGATEVGAGGVLAPGNSIGELTVNGDLTLMDGAAFEVEVDPAGRAADHVHVTGQATLAGSVVHLGEAGEYRPISRYRILTADGGLVDRFDQVATDFLFLDAGLI